MITKDSAGNSNPNGFLRVELKDLLITSYKVSGNQQSGELEYNDGRYLVLHRFNPAPVQTEETKYYYGGRNILDSVYLVVNHQLRQRYVYDYDYENPNALTNPNFGLLYHGEQTIYTVSKRMVYDVVRHTQVTGNYRYELDANRRIRKAIVSGIKGKESITTYTYY